MPAEHHLDDVTDDGDLVIAVCDHVHETLPADPARQHSSRVLRLVCPTYGCRYSRRERAPWTRAPQGVCRPEKRWRHIPPNRTPALVRSGPAMLRYAGYDEPHEAYDVARQGSAVLLAAVPDADAAAPS